MPNIFFHLSLCCTVEDFQWIASHISSCSSQKAIVWFQNTWIIAHKMGYIYYLYLSSLKLEGPWSLYIFVIQNEKRSAIFFSVQCQKENHWKSLEWHECKSEISDQILEICSHTGLLIQRMSALSVSVSSGPKSVIGWASTRELCFLFSMLGLAVL